MSLIAVGENKPSLYARSMFREALAEPLDALGKHTHSLSWLAARTYLLGEPREIDADEHSRTVGYTKPVIWAPGIIATVYCIEDAYRADLQSLTLEGPNGTLELADDSIDQGQQLLAVTVNGGSQENHWLHHDDLKDATRPAVTEHAQRFFEANRQR